MTSRRVLAALAALLLPFALLAAAPTSDAASAASSWAPAAKATITPGVMMYTRGAQCTANFVFRDAAGHTYVGYAAHCAGTGSSTDTNGCTTKSFPLGTRVRFASDGNVADPGTTVGRGRLVYSSWIAMHRLGTTARNTCAYNDLALVRVGRRYVRHVNPTVPFWGGPTGLARRTGTASGDRVYSYGNSSLRGGAEPLRPKTGSSLGDAARHWSHTVATATPGIPGDSGSGFMTAHGRALGVLSTVELAPVPGANGVGDLPRELAFAQRHSGLSGLHLVKGTKKFSPVL
ncbi:MAG: hypothetical protein ACXVXC_06680 [Nocardioidaceae bacterium]